MTLAQSDLAELLEAVRAGGDLDVVRSAVAFMLQALIEAEASEHIGAGRFERSATRVTQRNGGRERLVSTKAGDVTLKIPKLRQGKPDVPAAMPNPGVVEQDGYACWLVGTSKVTSPRVQSLGATWVESRLSAALWLRPEFVPSVEVVKVLPTVGNPAVLELEENTVANIQVLAVSLRGAALDADHAVVIICKQVLQLGPEGAPRLLPQPAEVGKGRLAALVVFGQLAPPRQVPPSALVEGLGERVHVGRVEGLVSAPHDRYVFGCSHRFPSALSARHRERERSRLRWTRVEGPLYDGRPKAPMVDSRWWTGAERVASPAMSADRQVRLPKMPRLRRVPLPPKTLMGRQWERWEVVDQNGERAGWVTEEPAGGQVYEPGGGHSPSEWTARSTDGWSEPGHDSAAAAEATLEHHLYG